MVRSSQLAFAQNQVNGIVTDKTGEPLIGVNVVEKGTTNGVTVSYTHLDVYKGQAVHRYKRYR